MNRIEIPGGWYGECLPSGEYAVALFEQKAVSTHKGIIPVDKNLLFLRCTRYPGQFKFAGQDHSGEGNFESIDLGPLTRAGDSFGVNPVIYDLQGNLIQARDSHQGYRYVGPDNRARTGDETFRSPEGLHEYTDLPDLRVGQFDPPMCAAIMVNGTLRELEKGHCTFIRANHDSAVYSFAIVKLLERKTVLLWLTRAELAQLPEVKLGPKPIPNPTPNPDPRKDPKMPVDPTQIPPEAPNVFNVILEVAAVSKVDRTKEVIRGEFTSEVVERLGYFPWGRKDRDRFPDNNNNNDDGLTYRRKDGRFEIYDIIIGDEGKPGFDYAGTFNDGENGYFREVPRKAPGKPQDEPKDPSPILTLVKDVEALKSAVGALQNQMGQAAQLFQQVGAELELLKKPKEFEIKLSRSWGHSHDASIKEVK